MIPEGCEKFACPRTRAVEPGFRMSVLCIELLILVVAASRKGVQKVKAAASHKRKAEPPAKSAKKGRKARKA